MDEQMIIKVCSDNEDDFKESPSLPFWDLYKVLCHSWGNHEATMENWLSCWNALIDQISKVT